MSEQVVLLKSCVKCGNEGGNESCFIPTLFPTLEADDTTAPSERKQ